MIRLPMVCSQPCHACSGYLRSVTCHLDISTWTHSPTETFGNAAASITVLVHCQYEYSTYSDHGIVLQGVDDHARLSDDFVIYLHPRCVLIPITLPCAPHRPIASFTHITIISHQPSLRGGCTPFTTANAGCQDSCGSQVPSTSPSPQVSPQHP